MQRRPEMRVHEERADHDERDDDRELDRDDDVVHERRLRDAEHEEPGHGGDREHGRQVHEAGPDRCAGREVADRRVERAAQPGRDVDPEVVQEARHVAGPADRHRRGGEPILEHQQHTHDPRGELAERRVRIRIRRARDRDRRCELGIGKRDERAERAGDHERDHDRGARELRGRAAGQHEDTGADDAADAEQHEVERAERFFQLAVLVLGMHLLDRFAREQARETLRHQTLLPYPLGRRRVGFRCRHAQLRPAPIVPSALRPGSGRATTI